MTCAFDSPPALAVGASGQCTWPYTLLPLLNFLNTQTTAFLTAGSTLTLPGSGLLTANCTVSYNTSTVPSRTGVFPTATSCLFDVNNAQALNASGCGVLNAGLVQYDAYQNVFLPLNTSEPVQQTYLSGGATTCTTCPAGTNCTRAGTTQPAPCPLVRTAHGLSDVPSPTFDVHRTCLLSRTSQGAYCPAGTVTPIPCAPGSYASMYGSAICSNCPQVRGGGGSLFIWRPKSLRSPLRIPSAADTPGIVLCE